MSAAAMKDEPIYADPYTRIAWLHEQLDALLADALTLMDQHASEEVQMEARRRIIERHREAKP